MKIIYVSCVVNNYYMKVDRWSYRRNFCSYEKKPWKQKLGLYGIRTLDLCVTGAALLPIEVISQLGVAR